MMVLSNNGIYIIKHNVIHNGNYIVPDIVIKSKLHYNIEM